MEDGVTGRIEEDPVVAEERLSVGVEARRGDPQDAAGPERAATVAASRGRRFGAGARRRAGMVTASKAVGEACAGGPWLTSTAASTRGDFCAPFARLDSSYRPSERPHPGDELALAAADVEKPAVRVGQRKMSNVLVCYFALTRQERYENLAEPGSGSEPVAVATVQVAVARMRRKRRTRRESSPRGQRRPLVVVAVRKVDRPLVGRGSR